MYMVFLQNTCVKLYFNIFGILDLDNVSSENLIHEKRQFTTKENNNILSHLSHTLNIRITII